MVKISFFCRFFSVKNCEKYVPHLRGNYDLTEDWVSNIFYDHLLVVTPIFLRSRDIFSKFFRLMLMLNVHQQNDEFYVTKIDHTKSKSRINQTFFGSSSVPFRVTRAQKFNISWISLRQFVTKKCSTFQILTQEAFLLFLSSSIHQAGLPWNKSFEGIIKLY